MGLCSSKVQGPPPPIEINKTIQDTKLIQDDTKPKIDQTNYPEPVKSMDGTSQLTTTSQAVKNQPINLPLLAPSDVPQIDILTVLLDVRKCKAFFKFLRASSLNPSKGSNLLKENFNDVRENSLAFWLDVNDFSRLPTSSFRSYRAQYIFDTFIAEGSKRQLPIVSTVDLRQISDELDADETKENISVHIFDHLVSESMIIIQEAFNIFIQTGGPLGYKESALAASYDPFPTHSTSDVENRQKIKELIANPSKCKAFRKYLVRLDVVENLWLVVDIMEFQDLIQALHLNNTNTEGTVKVQTNTRFVIRQAHKIFNKYIRQGSKSQVLIHPLIRDEIIKNIVKVPPPADLLDSTLSHVLYMLVHRYLPAFNDTKEYVTYQARESERERKQSVIASSIAPGHIGANGLPNDNDDYIANLKTLLASNKANYFFDYLRNEDLDNTVAFYQEVEQYCLLPDTQKAYIQGKASKIFHKFIRRGAQMEIEMTEDIRRNIFLNITDPPPKIFDEAKKQVVDLWEKIYYLPFLSSTYYTSMQSNIQNIHENIDENTFTEIEKMESTRIHIGNMQLKDFLRNVEFARLFRSFLETEENCVQLLLFYLEIEDYKRLPKSDYLSQRARKLYNRFLGSNAKEQVTISKKIADELKELLLNPSPITFNGPQQEIYMFMSIILYPKFKKSSYFLGMNKSLLKFINEEKGKTASIHAFNEDIKSQLKMDKILNQNDNETNIISSAPGSLLSILNDTRGRNLFSNFCESIHCEESVYFWIDCEEFRLIPHIDYVKLRAQKIYRKYISEDAKLQVNIKGNTVLNIEKNLLNPTRNLFLNAQDEILMVMERDTVPKFQKSKQFKDYNQLVSMKKRHSGVSN